MSVERAIISRDVRSYVLSKEFLFIGFLLPLLIAAFMSGVSTGGNHSQMVYVSIAENGYYPLVSSIIANNTNYTMVTTGANVIVTYTVESGSPVLYFTGVINVTTRNPNFGAIENSIVNAILRANGAPSLKYGAIVEKPGRTTVIPQNPESVLKEISSLMTAGTLFVFFIIITAISTIINSIIDDRRSKFLYTFMASPARRSSYVVGKIVASIIISLIIIGAYSVLVVIVSSGGAGVPQEGGEAFVPIVSGGAIVLSFVISLFSMLFLMLTSMFVIFKVTNDKTAVTISNSLVDALVMPAFIVSLITNMINFLANPIGRAFFVLNPATSPVMIMYYSMSGNVAMEAISAAIPVVSSGIMLYLVKKSLEDLK